MNFILDGGPVFMVPLLILLIVIVVLFIKGLKDNTEKTHKLINSLALFAFVFGVLGFVIGLLGALENISEMNGDISNQVLAGGFKVGLLAPTFGMVIFLLGKLFTIILTWMKK
jgi:biopolymer transport protein ExbB/TolQ